MSLCNLTCTLNCADLLGSLMSNVDGNGGEYFAQKVNSRYSKFQPYLFVKCWRYVFSGIDFERIVYKFTKRKKKIVLLYSRLP